MTRLVVLGYIILIGVREGILLGGAEKICPENNNLH